MSAAQRGRSGDGAASVVSRTRYVDGVRVEDNGHRREPPSLRTVFRSLDTVETKKVQWAWRKRIAAYRLNMVAGTQGVGKSQLAAEMVARHTERGRTALWLSAEDDDEDTTRPRLEAAGADLSKVYSLRSDFILGLPDNIDDLKRFIREAKASLVVLDPILAFLDGKVDAYRDHHVRRVLAPIRALASDTRCTVVGVMHLKKDQEGEAVNAVGGSIAWTAAPRSVLLVTRAADRTADPDGRVVWHTKCNVGVEQPPLEARLVAQRGVSHIELGDENQGLDIYMHLGGRRVKDEHEQPSRDEAREFILEALADGEQHLAKHVKRAATAAGISASTLRRARLDLRGEGRVFWGTNDDDDWYWQRQLNDDEVDY